MGHFLNIKLRILNVSTECDNHFSKSGSDSSQTGQSARPSSDCQTTQLRARDRVRVSVA